MKKWTQVLYMTEEVLLQLLMKEGPGYLQGVYAIILDEAHERSLRLDLLLGWLRHLQETGLQVHLLVTSATLDRELFSKYLGDCPVVMIAGRMFPVQDIFAPPPTSLPLQQYLQQKVVQLHREAAVDEGDILAFLPGQQEVESSRRAVEQMLRNDSKSAQVFALHGGQEPEDQAPVFEKLQRGRKIIFATNVAETSVTIDGVRMVVDSGMEKQAIFDAKRSQDALNPLAALCQGRVSQCAPSSTLEGAES